MSIPPLLGRVLQGLLLACAVSIVWLSPLQAEFNPPRVAFKIHPQNTGSEPDSELQKIRFYIDGGLETSINRGDVLNVYREKRLSRQVARPLRMLIGTMVITDSQPGSSIGVVDSGGEASILRGAVSGRVADEDLSAGR